MAIEEEFHHDEELEVEEDRNLDALLENEEEMSSDEEDEEDNIDDLDMELEELKDLEMNSESEGEEETHDEEDTNDTKYTNTPVPAKRWCPYTLKEMNQIFRWVEHLLKTERRDLNRKDFDIIAAWRNEEFQGKRVEIGDMLADSVKLATFAYDYPRRDGNALHSYCTKKSTNGSVYRHLCETWRRIRGD
jgi:hypothetical protein